MKTQKYILIVFALILTISAASCGKRYEKKETAEYRINANGKTEISVENINGKIIVTRGDSTEGIYVKADMISYVKKRDLDKSNGDVRIEIDSSGNTVKIKGTYNREKHFINFETGKNSKIDFLVRVPAGLKVDVENVNGKVDISNISEDVKVNLINGDITLQNTAGTNIIDLTNGSVKGTFDSTKGMNIDVVNGNINLDLSKNYQGEINADIVHGKINFNDLNVTVRSDEKKSFRGYIGNSIKTIKCEVVNGKITFNGK
jgi:uncharacterized lipoprotein YehR (DUF1307 family)